MNEILERVVEKIISDEEKLAYFVGLQDADEIYRYCLSIEGGYSKEEFDKYMEEIMNRFEKIEKGSLNSKKGRVFSKVLAAGLAALSITPMVSNNLLVGAVNGGETSTGSREKMNFFDSLLPADKAELKKVAAGTGVGITFGIGVTGLVAMLMSRGRLQLAAPEVIDDLNTFIALVNSVNSGDSLLSTADGYLPAIENLKSSLEISIAMVRSGNVKKIYDLRRIFAPSAKPVFTVGALDGGASEASKSYALLVGRFKIFQASILAEGAVFDDRKKEILSVLEGLYKSVLSFDGSEGSNDFLKPS
jgi:hypothetical protein